MGQVTAVRIVLAAAAILGTTAAARADDHLKVVMGGRSQGETFITEVGNRAGIFKKHGLDLEILYTDGGGETQQVVIAGSANIGGAVGFPGVLGVYAKGAPIRVIGASFTGGSQIYWYVRADSPIKTVADLAGKTISYSVTGSSTHSGLLAMQKYTGVNFKPTATGSAIGTFTQVMSGQIDAGWAGAPFGVDAIEQGKTRVIMKMSDSPDLDKQTIRLTIANAADLKARPDVYMRFMRGYRETIDWIYSTPEGLKAYAEFAQMSEATTRRAITEFMPRAAVDPDRISGLDEVMADAVRFKFISAPLTRAQLDELIQIPERRRQ
jgi:NitT/TauT family transport system substrate-binding protein